MNFGGPKTITYTKIHYQDLNVLIGEKLGVAVEVPTDGSTYGNYNFQKDMSWDGNGLPQDSYRIFPIEELLDTSVEDQYPVTHKYLRLLVEGGHLPKEHPIFVEVWW